MQALTTQKLKLYHGTMCLFADVLWPFWEVQKKADPIYHFIWLNDNVKVFPNQNNVRWFWGKEIPRKKNKEENFFGAILGQHHVYHEASACWVIATSSSSSFFTSEEKASPVGEHLASVRPFQLWSHEDYDTKMHVIKLVS